MKDREMTKGAGRSGHRTISKMAGALLAASAIVTPAVALAQQTATTNEVSEIVITAQRQAQSILDVGINVTALSGQQLQDNRIAGLVDLAQVTSGVELRNGRSTGQPIITIRGVGMNDFTAAGNPSTAVYIDNVYYPNIGTLGGQLFDVGGAEVLKGPQSTLYGRNATAGSVNITSAVPTPDFSGYGMIGYGSYNTIDAEGAISGPLSKTLSGRLSAVTQQRSDGYITNLYPGGDVIGDSHKVSVRAQLLWQPTDRFDLHSIVAYANENDTPGAFTAFGIRLPGGGPGKPTPAFCPTYLANKIDYANQCASILGAQRTSTDIFTVSENDSWKVKSDTFTATATASYRGDGYSFKSTTAYLYWQELYNKSDSLPITAQTQALHQRTWQLSQDFQLASAKQNPVGWIAGLYFSTGNTNNPTYYLQQLASGLFANTITLADMDVRTAQAYAQGYYDLTDKLQITVGARGIYEEDHKTGGSYTLSNYVGGPNNGVLTPAYKTVASIDRSIKQKALTWKVGANYKPSNDSLLYVSATRGFKSGGFTSNLASNNAQLQPYKGEYIISYEAGFKQFMFDNAIQLSGSVFYYDYKNLQAPLIVLIDTTRITVFANLPKAHVIGADFDAKFRPITGLEIQLGVGLIDTAVGSFLNVNGVVIPKGNQLANAPKFTGTAQARYEHPINDAYSWAIAGSVHHQGKVFTDTVNTLLLRESSDATLVDARVEFLDASNGRTLTFWGRNLTNEAYTNSSFTNGTTMNTIFNMPRTYGLSLRQVF